MQRSIRTAIPRAACARWELFKADGDYPRVSANGGVMVITAGGMSCQ